MSYLLKVLQAETAGEVVSMEKFKRDRAKIDFEAAVRKLAAVGIVLKKTGRHRRGELEYYVNHKKGIEATAVYTTDLQDAIDSGIGLSYWSEDASVDPNILNSIVDNVLEKAKSNG